MSSKLIVEWHPRQLVEELVTRRGRDLVFTYSRYEVAELGLQATAPRSDVLRVPASDVTSSWLADRFAALGPNEEMAWHSWVECKGVGFHIPMIDFIGHPDPSELSQLSKVLAARMGLKGHFVFFETGRSFHGYFPDLIAEGALPKYLGQLLLLNEHDRPELIDTRWSAMLLSEALRRFVGVTTRTGTVGCLVLLRFSTRKNSDKSLVWGIGIAGPRGAARTFAAKSARSSNGFRPVKFRSISDTPFFIRRLCNAPSGRAR